MKAFTLASLSALALVGVACSESTPTETDGPDTATMPATETSASTEDSGFNLNLFEEEGGDSGFNIGFEDDTSDPLSGFDFGNDTGSLLSDVPAIEAPVLEDDSDELVQLPKVPSQADDDEIIRLPE